MSAKTQTTTLGSDLFIDGQWKQGAAGSLENIDAGNGETIGAVTLANQADVQAALDAAAAAFLSWSAIIPAQRGALLKRAAALLQGRFIARELIRIDTTNYSTGNAVGEQKAADYVARLLTDVGLKCQCYEAEPGRTNLIARWRGADPDLPALLLHVHLDVVPADASEWSVNPFDGVIKDGMLWGRGAVDMKDMNAMIIASVRALAAEGFMPRRDIILAFFADEEANSVLGSRWLIKHHPEVFAGADVAISEVGGYTVNGMGGQSSLSRSAKRGSSGSACAAVDGQDTPPSSTTRTPSSSWPGQSPGSGANPGP
jgi:hypothetical protein